MTDNDPPSRLDEKKQQQISIAFKGRAAQLRSVISEQ